MYPELEVPETRGRQPGGLVLPGTAHDRTVASVRLRLAGSELCLQLEEGAGAVLRTCSHHHPDQVTEREGAVSAAGGGRRRAEVLFTSPPGPGN